MKYEMIIVKRGSGPAMIFWDDDFGDRLRAEQAHFEESSAERPTKIWGVVVAQEGTIKKETTVCVTNKRPNLNGVVS